MTRLGSHLRSARRRGRTIRGARGARPLRPLRALVALSGAGAGSFLLALAFHVEPAAAAGTFSVTCSASSPWTVSITGYDTVHSPNGTTAVALSAGALSIDSAALSTYGGNCTSFAPTGAVTVDASQLQNSGGTAGNGIVQLSTDGSKLSSQNVTFVGDDSGASTNTTLSVTSASARLTPDPSTAGKGSVAGTGTTSYQGVGGTISGSGATLDLPAESGHTDTVSVGAAEATTLTVTGVLGTESYSGFTTYVAAASTTTSITDADSSPTSALTFTGNGQASGMSLSFSFAGALSKSGAAGALTGSYKVSGTSVATFSAMGSVTGTAPAFSVTCSASSPWTVSITGYDTVHSPNGTTAVALSAGALSIDSAALSTYGGNCTSFAPTGAVTVDASQLTDANGVPGNGIVQLSTDGSKLSSQNVTFVGDDSGASTNTTLSVTSASARLTPDPSTAGKGSVAGTGTTSYQGVGGTISGSGATLDLPAESGHTDTVSVGAAEATTLTVTGVLGTESYSGFTTYVAAASTTTSITDADSSPTSALTFTGNGQASGMSLSFSFAGALSKSGAAGALTGSYKVSGTSVATFSAMGSVTGTAPAFSVTCSASSPWTVSITGYDTVHSPNGTTAVALSAGALSIDSAALSTYGGNCTSFAPTGAVTVDASQLTDANGVPGNGIVQLSTDGSKLSSQNVTFVGDDSGASTNTTLSVTSASARLTPDPSTAGKGSVAGTGTTSYQGVGGTISGSGATLDLPAESGHTDTVSVGAAEATTLTVTGVLGTESYSGFTTYVAAASTTTSITDADSSPTSALTFTGNGQASGMSLSFSFAGALSKSGAAGALTGSYKVSGTSVATFSAMGSVTGTAPAFSVTCSASSPWTVSITGYDTVHSPNGTTAVALSAGALSIDSAALSTYGGNCTSFAPTGAVTVDASQLTDANGVPGNGIVQLSTDGSKLSSQNVTFVGDDSGASTNTTLSVTSASARLTPDPSTAGKGSVAGTGTTSYQGVGGTISGSGATLDLPAESGHTDTVSVGAAEATTLTVTGVLGTESYSGFTTYVAAASTTTSITDADSSPTSALTFTGNGLQTSLFFTFNGVLHVIGSAGSYHGSDKVGTTQVATFTQMGSVTSPFSVSCSTSSPWTVTISGYDNVHSPNGTTAIALSGGVLSIDGTSVLASSPPSWMSGCSTFSPVGSVTVDASNAADVTGLSGSGIVQIQSDGGTFTGHGGTAVPVSFLGDDTGASTNTTLSFSGGGTLTPSATIAGVGTVVSGGTTSYQGVGGTITDTGGTLALPVETGSTDSLSVASGGAITLTAGALAAQSFSGLTTFDASSATGTTIAFTDNYTGASNLSFVGNGSSTSITFGGAATLTPNPSAAGKGSYSTDASYQGVGGTITDTGGTLALPVETGSTDSLSVASGGAITLTAGALAAQSFSGLTTFDASSATGTTIAFTDNYTGASNLSFVGNGSSTSITFGGAATLTPNPSAAGKGSYSTDASYQGVGGTITDTGGTLALPVETGSTDSLSVASGGAITLTAGALAAQSFSGLTTFDASSATGTTIAFTDNYTGASNLSFVGNGSSTSITFGGAATLTPNPSAAGKGSYSTDASYQGVGGTITDTGGTLALPVETGSTDSLSVASGGAITLTAGALAAQSFSGLTTFDASSATGTTIAFTDNYTGASNLSFVGNGSSTSITFGGAATLTPNPSAAGKGSYSTDASYQGVGGTITDTGGTLALPVETGSTDSLSVASGGAITLTAGALAAQSFSGLTTFDASSATGTTIAFTDNYTGASNLSFVGNDSGSSTLTSLLIGGSSVTVTFTGPKAGSWAAGTSTASFTAVGNGVTAPTASTAALSGSHTIAVTSGGALSFDAATWRITNFTVLSGSSGSTLDVPGAVSVSSSAGVPLVAVTGVTVDGVTLSASGFPTVSATASGTELSLGTAAAATVQFAVASAPPHVTVSIGANTVAFDNYFDLSGGGSGSTNQLTIASGGSPVGTCTGFDGGISYTISSTGYTFCYTGFSNVGFTGSGAGSTLSLGSGTGTLYVDPATGDVIICGSTSEVGSSCTVGKQTITNYGTVAGSGLAVTIGSAATVSVVVAGGVATIENSGTTEVKLQGYTSITSDAPGTAFSIDSSTGYDLVQASGTTAGSLTLSATPLLVCQSAGTAFFTSGATCVGASPSLQFSNLVTFTGPGTGSASTFVLAATTGTLSVAPASGQATIGTTTVSGFGLVQGTGPAVSLSLDSGASVGLSVASGVASVTTGSPAVTSVQLQGFTSFTSSTPGTAFTTDAESGYSFVQASATTAGSLRLATSGAVTLCVSTATVYFSSNPTCSGTADVSTTNIATFTGGSGTSDAVLPAPGSSGLTVTQTGSQVVIPGGDTLHLFFTLTASAGSGTTTFSADGTPGWTFDGSSSTGSNAVLSYAAAASSPGYTFCVGLGSELVNLTGTSCTSGSSTDSFSQIATIVGSPGPDTFVVTANSTVNNTNWMLSGGGGSDTLDLAPAVTQGSGVTVDLNAQTVSGLLDQVQGALAFAAIDNVIGPSGGSFTVYASKTSPGFLQSGGGTSVNDFVLEPGANVVIEGGGNSSTIDLSAATVPVTLNLGDPSFQNTGGDGTVLVLGASVGSVKGAVAGSTIIGGSMPGTITGQASSGSTDYLAAGAGATTLQETGSGTAVLVAGSGSDTLQGGSGTNYFAPGAGALSVSAGSGATNWLDFAGAPSAVIVNLSGSAADYTPVGSSQQIVVPGVSGGNYLSGGWQSGSLSFDVAVNNVIGSSFSDVLVANSQTDSIISAGAAIIVPGSGVDHITCTTGSDCTVDYENVAPDTALANSPGISLTASGSNGQVDKYIYGSVDTLSGVSVIVSTSQGNDSLAAFAPNQTLVALHGNDLLQASAQGYDTLIGGNGPGQTLFEAGPSVGSGYFGGAGHNTMIGGTSSDAFLAWMVDESGATPQLINGNNTIIAGSIFNVIESDPTDSVSGPNNQPLDASTTHYWGILTGFAQNGQQLITQPLGSGA